MVSIEAMDEEQLPTDSLVQNKANLKSGTTFLEVVNNEEAADVSRGEYEQQLTELRKKANFSENEESKTAVAAAI